MSFTAALLILAQSASPQVAEVPVVKSSPVAAQARASAKIIRPAQIDFSAFEESRFGESKPSERESQSSRDAAGTPWVEFS